MATCNAPLRDFSRKCKAIGASLARADKRGSGHWMLHFKEFSQPILVGSTNSDWRAEKNALALVKRELRAVAN
jgi:hypothetical protein